jgi:hypothetical protein
VLRFHFVHYVISCADARGPATSSSTRLSGRHPMLMPGSPAASVRKATVSLPGLLTRKLDSTVTVTAFQSGPAARFPTADTQVPAA